MKTIVGTIILLTSFLTPILFFIKYFVVDMDIKTAEAVVPGMAIFMIMYLIVCGVFTIWSLDKIFKKDILLLTKENICFCRECILKRNGTIK